MTGTKLDLTMLELGTLEKVAKHATICHEFAMKAFPAMLPGYLMPEKGTLNLYTSRIVDNPYLPEIIYEFPRLIVTGLKDSPENDQITISGNVHVELENDHVGFDVYLIVIGFSKEKLMDLLIPERILEIMIDLDKDHDRFGYFWANQCVKIGSMRSTSAKYPGNRWDCSGSCDDSNHCDSCFSYKKRLRWYIQELTFNLHGYILHGYDLDEWTFFKDHPIKVYDKVDDGEGDFISEMIKEEACECKPEFIKPVIDGFIKTLLGIIRGENCTVRDQKNNIVQID